MKIPRSVCAAGVIGDSLLICGGRGGNGRMERLTLSNGVWNTKPIKTPVDDRYDANAVVCNGSLHIFSGCDAFGLSDAHHVFDDNIGKWRRAGTCPVRRQGAATVVVGESIYILVGPLPFYHFYLFYHLRRFLMRLLITKLNE
jgi:N-acetylneuraminic acid mutarotase